MIPYILVLIFSIIISSFAEKNFKVGNKKRGIIYLIFLVILLSLFAGLRTTDLGFDTGKYVMTTYRLLNSGKTLSYLLNNYTSMEKGFLIYMYSLYNINPDINFILIFLNVPVNLCFVIFMYHYKDKVSMMLMTIVYYCTLYAFSFNIVRQSIALSIFLLVLVFLDKKNYFISILLFLLGTLFHSSMILAFLTIFIILLSDNKKLKSSNKTIILLLLVALTLFFLIFYDKIIMLAYHIGLIGSRYLNYLNENSKDYRSSIDIEYSLLFLKLSIIIFYMIYNNLKTIPSKIKDENKKWVTMLFIDLIVSILSFKLRNTDRISWYMYYPAVFLLAPQLGCIIVKSKRGINVGNIIVMMVFILYLLEKLITNQYGICPYTWVL